MLACFVRFQLMHCQCACLLHLLLSADDWCPQSTLGTYQVRAAR